MRTPDGGYAKSAEGALGSTYQSFLVAMTYELLGKKPPKLNKLGQFLFDRQREDGGFVEIAGRSERGDKRGTNAGPSGSHSMILAGFGLRAPGSGTGPSRNQQSEVRSLKPTA